MGNTSSKTTYELCHYIFINDLSPTAFEKRSGQLAEELGMDVGKVRKIRLLLQEGNFSYRMKCVDFLDSKDRDASLKILLETVTDRNDPVGRHLREMMDHSGGPEEFASKHRRNRSNRRPWWPFVAFGAFVVALVCMQLREQFHATPIVNVGIPFHSLPRDNPSLPSEEAHDACEPITNDHTPERATVIEPKELIDNGLTHKPNAIDDPDKGMKTGAGPFHAENESEHDLKNAHIFLFLFGFLFLVVMRSREGSANQGEVLIEHPNPNTRKCCRHEKAYDYTRVGRSAQFQDSIEIKDDAEVHLRVQSSESVKVGHYPIPKVGSKVKRQGKSCVEDEVQPIPRYTTATNASPHISLSAMSPIWPESIRNCPESVSGRPRKECLGMEGAALALASCDEVTLDDLVCSTLSRRTLETMLSFLKETKLQGAASLASILWTDCATNANDKMILMSVACVIDSYTSYTNRSNDDAIAVEILQTYGFMEREWEFLVSSYPWACYLSEGTFKRVYKVFDYNHRVEEAISVMDLNDIKSTGNMNVVGAELVVSVLLSSLVRNSVCPNFVCTLGIFSCAYKPPARGWGSPPNKSPKWPSHASPRANQMPREPAPKHRGRYQYIRMELCDEGDAEEYLKRQPDGAIDPFESMKLFFQMVFAMHAAADRFGLKHYDVKLLNFVLKRIITKKTGNVVIRYGLGENTFALTWKCGQGIIAKLGDYGTANIDSGSSGQAVTVAQFTTLENTPIEYLILGDSAQQGHAHDCFGLGLCMLHLFTGHAPYEEILEEVKCPQNLKKELCSIWENESETGYSVIRGLLLPKVNEDKECHIIEEPEEVLYDTLYRFLVLFGIPHVSSSLSKSKVWIAIKNTLGSKESKSGETKGCILNDESTQFNHDRNMFSLIRGNNKYIARARKSLESFHGGLDLLLSLISFDPQTRALPLDVLNSPFFKPLQEEDEGSPYNEDDEVSTYNVFSS